METFRTSDRNEWRAYLESHFETAGEVWFVFPMKDAGEESLSYNDAVEEDPQTIFRDFASSIPLKKAIDKMLEE